jgi:hypothetical protein
MELDNVPRVAAFTATVETRIVSDNGTMCMNFEAGETLKVPRELYKEAVAAGLMPMEPLVLPKEPDVPEQVSEEELLLEAVKKLIIQGNPNDFTVVGQPRAASVKKLVNFRFTNESVRRAFELAMHEVEQNVDDDTEHSEQSVLVTE